MAGDEHRNELGEFLKARRAELSLRTVGLPGNGTRRRVAGLRREEVALLAEISTEYDTRLEQGRIQPAVSTLTTLARVLHLDDAQRDRLFSLAATETRRPRRRTVQKVRPQVRRLLDELTMAIRHLAGPATRSSCTTPKAKQPTLAYGASPETDDHSAQQCRQRR
jgi:transcriptional regulator with XRE-family HTH domain